MDGDDDDEAVVYSFVFSPFSWASAVSFGPYPNVGSWAKFERPAPENFPRQGISVPWPAYYATRDIAAREILQLPTDDNYVRVRDKRARLFARLAELIRSGATDDAINRELTKKFKLGDSVMAYWAPLRDVLGAS